MIVSLQTENGFILWKPSTRQRKRFQISLVLDDLKWPQIVKRMILIIQKINGKLFIQKPTILRDIKVVGRSLTNDTGFESYWAPFFLSNECKIFWMTFEKVGSTLYFKICSENNLSNIYFSVPDCTVSNDDESMTYNIIDFGWQIYVAILSVLSPTARSNVVANIIFVNNPRHLSVK